MIRRFRENDTEKVSLGERSRGFPIDLQRIAQRKLAMVDAAEVLPDLLVPNCISQCNRCQLRCSFEI